jgi:hypothetical protein
MAKRAVCVGINDYPGTNMDLSGCVNDARDWQGVLEARGYQVTSLVDAQATRAAMLEALTALVTSGASGDTLVFTYSGHGSWLPDESGDEDDLRDEMMCPYDVMDKQYLLDDDIAGVLAQKKAGVCLFIISDSCHSGSVTKFAPEIGPRGAHPIPRFLPPLTLVGRDIAMERAVEIASRSTKATRQAYPAVLFSGCRDDQFSYDTSFNGRPNGAFTRVAIEELAKGPATPRAWMDLIKARLPTPTLPQTPQLFAGAAGKRGPLF